MAHRVLYTTQFRYVHDPTLLEIGEEARKIKDSDEIIINADKTGNKYGTNVADYKQLLHENLTKDYILDKNNNLSIINEDTHKHAKLMNIADRMERHSETNAFLTVKDHKQGFPNNIKCRIINPTSNNLGKISKRILDKINSEYRKATNVNQWRSTQEVLEWFNKTHTLNPTKRNAKLLQFDISEFYPSISEDLLNKALTSGKAHTDIDREQEEMIKACRRSVIFNEGKAWTKKHTDFDVTMGAKDGAEIAELTGIYLLEQINVFLKTVNTACHAGLYRDDGLIYVENSNGPLLNRIEKALHRIFKSHHLTITIEQIGQTVNFLDVTLSTDKGSYKPYKKPNCKISYVNSASNHPPSILKNIPSSIQKRLTTISNSKQEFLEAKEEYEKALKDEGTQKF